MSKLQTNLAGRHWSGRGIFRRARKWRAKRKMRGEKDNEANGKYTGVKRDDYLLLFLSG